jgi:hypothetical protein
VKFFKPVPRVGAYYAQALANAATGEVKAVIAADTTITLGKGKPFTADDKKFIAEMAKKVSACLEAVDAKLVEYVAKATDAHAPPPPPEEGAEGAEGEAAAAEAAAPAEEAAPAESDPSEPSAVTLQKAKVKLGAAAEAVAAAKAEGVAVLKLYQAEPPATAALLRGALALLANSTAEVGALKWPELRAMVLAEGAEFFDNVAAFDAAATPLESGVAAFVRRSYFPLKARELWKESPLGGAVHVACSCPIS